MKFAVFVLMIFLVGTPSMAADKKRITDFTKSLRSFAASLFLEVASVKNDTDNIFFSPTSISEALGMVLIGAKGNTAREIKQQMQIDRTYSDYNVKKLYRKVHNRLLNATKNKGNYEALMANRIFLQNSYEILSTYRSDLDEFFDAEVKEVNFGEKYVTADIINDWVANKTEGLITDLINPEAIDSLTRMILVNTLYFKAAWENEMFRSRQLKNFTTLNGVVKKVPHMEQIEGMKYISDELGLQIAIPYKGGDAFLVLIVPPFDKFVEFGTSHLYRYLRSFQYTFDERMRSSRVNFSMPTFEIEQSMDVKKVLDDLGIRDLFKPEKADLTGIADERLYVSSFVHKAKITVDEEGTEAAAASAIHLTARSTGPAKVVIDRPFYFGIYRAGHMLFFGRVVDPVAPVKDVPK